MNQAVKETPAAREHAVAGLGWLATAQRVAAGYVCALIADGTLQAGQPAPSGAELSRLTGRSVVTCRRALRDLVAEGVLTEPPSVNGRPEVAGSTLPWDTQDTIPAAVALSEALGRGRRAAGLTQPDLAARLWVSVTAVGHAETGRLWQSPDFWLLADQLLGGNLARLYDEYAAARSRPLPPEHSWAADAERRARAGESMASIGRVYGVDWEVVKRALARRGVPHGRRVLLPAWAADAKTRYEDGEPAQSLARSYGVGHLKVKSVLEKQGVKIRDQKQAREASAKRRVVSRLPAEPPSAPITGSRSPEGIPEA